MSIDKTENAVAADRPGTLADDVKPKKRLCLKCRSPFESEGAGERVCRKCKSSSAWRSGR